MAPKFGRSRVSVMYRFLIVVCSLDLKNGEERVVCEETVTVAEEILFSFIKMSLTVCIIIARKIAKRHSVGEQAFIAATNSCALNSRIDLKYID